MKSDIEKKFSHLKIDHHLLEQLDVFVNRLSFVGGISSFIGMVFVLRSPDTIKWIALLDLFIFLICSLTYIFKDRIKTEYKLIIINILLLAFGIISFDRGGIHGTGLYMIITSIIISIGFLNRRFILITIGITVVQCIYIFTEVLKGTERFLASYYSDQFMVYIYIFTFIGVLILVSFTFITIDAIKRHLYKNINDLNDQMLIMEEKNEVLEEKNTEIEYLAYYNQLTNLPNRIHFCNEVEEYIKSKHSGVLILMDVIHFGKINAFYGMKKGDELLTFIGNFIEKKISEDCMAGYMGNNTMAIWVKRDMSEKEMKSKFIEYRGELRRKLENDIEFDLDAYMVGVALSQDMVNFDDIYTVADKTIKYIKHNDSKKVIFFDKGYSQRIDEYEIMQGIVESAIDHKEFEVFYQEKVDSRTGSVIGLEALARLRHNGEFIPPSVFIPIIEENDWAISFGNMINQKAVDDYPQLIEIYSKDIIISINVSPQQLRDGSFIYRLKKLLESANIMPEKIELEITENLLLTDLEKAAELLKRIKEIGVRISIDDFGTGYSSLRYIADLPVDIIKIDKSFTDRILDSSKIKAIIKAIIDIAHATDSLVIAEGVEYESQVNAYTSLDCHLIQGYYYSKPKSVSALMEERETVEEVPV